jgi:flagellar basal body-associated protein FliL
MVGRQLRRKGAAQYWKVSGRFAVSGKSSKTWLATAGVVVLAGAIGLGWWMGKERQAAPPAQVGSMV